MHAVRTELLRAQAEAAGLPLLEVGIPFPCTTNSTSRCGMNEPRRIVSLLASATEADVRAGLASGSSVVRTSAIFRLGS